MSGEGNEIIPIEKRSPKVPQIESQPLQPDYSQQAPAPQFPESSDRGAEVVATTLAPQLGSDASHLGRGNFDMRKLSVIEENHIPLLIYSKLRGKKTGVWGEIYDMFLNLNVSVNGRGRRDIIRMEGVSKGGLPDIQPELERPGWLSRNVTDRKWRDRMKDEML